MKPEIFDFLVFTHYVSKSRNGNFRVKRRTAEKKFRKKCKQLNTTIRDMRFEKKKYILEKVNQILLYWLNIRSQRKRYTWDGFNEFLKSNPVVRPKIYVSIYG